MSPYSTYWNSVLAQPNRSTDWLNGYGTTEYYPLHYHGVSTHWLDTSSNCRDGRTNLRWESRANHWVNVPTAVAAGQTDVQNREPSVGLAVAANQTDVQNSAKNAAVELNKIRVQSSSLFYYFRLNQDQHDKLSTKSRPTRLGSIPKWEVVPQESVVTLSI